MQKGKEDAGEKGSGIAVAGKEKGRMDGKKEVKMGVKTMIEKDGEEAGRMEGKGKYKWR